MKIKNLILTAAGILSFYSTSFAADAGAMSQGGLYTGLAAGLGFINGNNNYDTDSSTKSKGFSGRIYIGYLLPTNSAWLFGPELGYSGYQNDTYFAPVDDSLPNTEQSADGVDLLLNATYLLNQSVNLAIKPGVQFASETFTSASGSTQGFITHNKVIPELNVEANWQAFSRTPFFVGLSYQYAFGEHPNNGATLVTSRQMIAFNLEYLF